jgi:hypothetical protein
MTDSFSSSGASRAKTPRVFFEAQLPGEQPLSFETAVQLYQLSMEFFELKPWSFLDDDELILTNGSESGEICYCGVMGALGEVFSFQVYVGAESYRLFQRITSGGPLTRGEFYASMQGVSAEWVMATDRTAPDRELLQALGHPNKRGSRAPIFRAARPGFHSWYVTEPEARLLIHCLHAALAFCRQEAKPVDKEIVDYWEQKDSFPFVASEPNDKTGRRFQLSLVHAPEPPVVTPRPAQIDEQLMAEFSVASLPRQGSLEADYFYTGMRIGEKNERGACLHLAMVADGESGIAYQPELGRPGDPAGRLLVRALLGAMRAARRVPREVRVQRKEFKILLSALSERLGIVVRVTKSTPALNQLKRHFLRTIGEPAEIPVE